MSTGSGAVFFAAVAIITATAPASAPALVVACEEGVSEGLLKTEALSWVIFHHLLYQVKKLLVVFAL